MFHKSLIVMSDSFAMCSPGVGVWFSLRGKTYQNNSVVILEDIGVGDDALLCLTDQTACCRKTSTDALGSAIGNWFFPNGTRVPSSIVNTKNDEEWDMYITRGQSVVRLHRREGGEDGVYHCELPDATNVIQIMYIGVYTANTGEFYMDTSVPESSDRNSQ